MFVSAMHLHDRDDRDLLNRARAALDEASHLSHELRRELEAWRASSGWLFALCGTTPSRRRRSRGNSVRALTFGIRPSGREIHGNAE
jgi:hypothetical protein